MAGSYCKYVNELDKNSVHRMYHDTEYGFPIQDDDLLFARLVLEINQAGLSWDTILKKKENFFKAFDDFNIAKIARYSEKKKEKLMQDAGIIRNRLKIEAAIYNAKEIIALQKNLVHLKTGWINNIKSFTKASMIQKGSG
jgi:DNA-3-methyladenine glycosylase I